MEGIITAAHFISFCGLIGGVAFLWLIWRPGAAGNAPMSQQPFIQARWGILLAALTFLATGWADLLRAYHDVGLPLELSFFWMFLTQTLYGQLTLLKVGLAIVWVVLIWQGRHAGLVHRLVLIPLGIGLGLTLSLASHAGATGGVWPVVADTLHLLAAGVWAGGLLYLAIVPWSTWRTTSAAAALEHAAPVVRRFADIGIAAVTILGVTGFYLGTVHIYGAPALTGSLYGQALLRKIAFVTAIVGVAAVNHFYFRPMLQRALRPGALTAQGISRLLSRLRWSLRIESGLVLAVLVLTGMLTTYAPPEEPVSLEGPVTRQETLGDINMNLRVVSDTEGVSVFNILLQGPDGPLEDAVVSLRLDMPEHAMGVLRLRAEETRAGLYRAQGVLSMGGQWRADVEVARTGLPAESAVVEFSAATGARDRDLTTRLSLAPVWLYSDLTWLFSAFAFVGIAGLAGVLVGIRFEAGRWVIPIGAGLLTYAVYMIVPLLTVDAYPTTFVSNPAPYTAATVQAGRQVFENHCVVCHGPAGEGDGLQAAVLNPRPADLTDVHVETHTDGDLFWWISHGIPATTMPAFAETLSEEERWRVINYIRSLRDDRGP